jgi:hypothetical protein
MIVTKQISLTLPALLSWILAAPASVCAGALDSWTYRTNGVSASAELDSVTYGAGRFVAAGAFAQGSLILSSEDGILWTQRVVGPASEFYCVRYAGEKFVATGSGGVVAVSTNGIDWTSTVISNTPYLLYLFGATHGNAQFVAVGMQYNPDPFEERAAIYTSADALSWSPTWISNTNSVPLEVAYGNGRFVAVGSGYPTYTSSDVFISRDGLNWTPHGSGNPDLFGIVYGGGQFVATTGSALMLTSADGETWTPHPIALTNAHFYGVGYGNGTYLAVGSVNGSQQVLARSQDGTNWQTQVIGPSREDYSLYDATFGARPFVVVGVWGPHAMAQSSDVALPSFAAIQRFNGTVALDIEGEIGRPYRLQVSSDLKSWNNLLNYTNDAAVTRVTDGSALLEKVRFYRSVSP